MEVTASNSVAETPATSSSCADGAKLTKETGEPLSQPHAATLRPSHKMHEFSVFICLFDKMVRVRKRRSFLTWQAFSRHVEQASRFNGSGHTGFRKARTGLS